MKRRLTILKKKGIQRREKDDICRRYFRKEMYLVMFKKGQQAASMEITEHKMIDALTEDRVTLKFLHDAFYYYLLNRGDSQEHLSVFRKFTTYSISFYLQVIMTMLGFTSNQKAEIANRKRGRSS